MRDWLTMDTDAFAMGIVDEVAAATRVPTSLLLSKQRTHRVARARQAAMYRLRQETKMSMPEIGRLFGRDHTTVLHALRAVEGRMAKLREAAQ